MDKCTIPDLCMEEALEDVYFLKKKSKLNGTQTSKTEKEPVAIPGQNFSCTLLIILLSISLEKMVSV